MRITTQIDIAQTGASAPIFLPQGDGRAQLFLDILGEAEVELQFSDDPTDVILHRRKDVLWRTHPCGILTGDFAMDLAERSTAVRVRFRKLEGKARLVVSQEDAN